MSSSDGGEVSGDGGARVSEVEQTRKEAGAVAKVSDGDGDDDLFATISVKEELDQESCDGNPMPETVDQILSEALFALASEEPILRGGSTKLELSPTGSSPSPSFGQVPNPNPNPNFDPNPNPNPNANANPKPDPEPNPRESGCCPEASEKDSKEGLSALLVPIGEKKRKRTVSSSSSSSSDDESGSKDSSSCSSSPSSDLSSSSSSSSSSSHGPATSSSSSSSSSSDESASPGLDTNGALDSCDSALTWSSSSSSPLSSSCSSSSSFSDSDDPQQRSSHCKRGRFCIGRR